MLYEIDPEEYEANLQTARAQLARAEANLEAAGAKLAKAQQDVARYRPLAAARAVPQQDLDTALAAEQVARAEVDQAVRSFARTPHSGERGEPRPHRHARTP